MFNKKTILGWIITIVSFVFGYILVRYLGLIFFIFPLVFFIGYWSANWYSKKENQNYKLKNIICWSNVITWFLPVLGLGTGIASYRFGQIENNKKYKKLGILGLFLSIINGISGVYLNYLSSL